MTLNKTLLLGLALSALASGAALAHDPALHAQEGAAKKAKPTTCAQLADREHYSNDLADADIKALKTRCDAARKAPAQAEPAAQAGSKDGKNSD